MQTILLATRNAGKCAEFQAMLADAACRLLTIPDAGMPLPEVEEDGQTFADNAVKKATELARASGCLTMADDSGLEVDALGGDPGVRSARYAGEPCSDAHNNAKLLAALDGVENRRARFRCVLALASPDGDCATVSGVCEGHIAHSMQGDGGFGYDPLFVPDVEEARSFAELSPAEKHAMSHRGQALQAALEAWFRDGAFHLPARTGTSVAAADSAGSSSPGA